MMPGSNVIGIAMSTRPPSQECDGCRARRSGIRRFQTIGNQMRVRDGVVRRLPRACRFSSESPASIFHYYYIHVAFKAVNATTPGRATSLLISPLGHWLECCRSTVHSSLARACPADLRTGEIVPHQDIIASTIQRTCLNLSL